MTVYDPIYLSEAEHAALDHADVPGVQSGATVLPWYELLLNNSYGYMCTMFQLPPDGEWLTFISSGPSVVAPEGFVAAVGFGGSPIIPAEAPGPAVVISTLVSNVDGTEVLVIDGTVTSDAGEPLAFATLTDADWAIDYQVGTDLSIGPSGEIISAAGGVFWATVTFAYTAFD